LRKLERPEAPESLRTGAPQWTEEFVARRLENPKHRFSWRSDDCYQQIRRTLSTMTAAHCAFCDGPIGVESRETVEHFKPKSRFPELAYEWTNLFPCCDMCQSNKRESFDPDLIKPDLAEYAFEHYFVANYKTGEIEASPARGDEFKRAAEITIAMYGLNIPARNKARLREWE
jgi:uncharacterized protein (TIGR02646 family)